MNQIIDFGHSNTSSADTNAGIELLFSSPGSLGDLGKIPGPLAVADASRFIELFEMQVGISVSELGFTAEITNTPTPLEGARARMIDALGKGHFPVLVGEDRTLTEKCCCSNLVALWGKAGRMEIDEGNLFSRQRTIMAGLRSATNSAFQAVPSNATIITADALIHHQEAFANVLRAEASPVYLSIDLDVLSPGTAQNGRSVEPGGLNWYHLMSTIDAVFNGPGVLAAEIIGTLGVHPRTTAASICAQIMMRIAGLSARGR